MTAGSKLEKEKECFIASLNLKLQVIGLKNRRSTFKVTGDSFSIS